MKSCLYTGKVRHRRFTPVGNEFAYRLYMTYLDLDELGEVFRGRWLWSAGARPAVSWFRRADYLGDPAVPLAEAVRDLVAERTGRRPGGAVRLLTNLRTWGYAQNPVSFYYCYAPGPPAGGGGERLEAIVAHITNTPWGERHAYVLDAEHGEREGNMLRWKFGKEFHVSPFMPMEMTYDWRFLPPGPTLVVRMENHEDGRRVFDATLTLSREEIRGASLARALATRPFLTAKVVAAIYGQAARLWWKRCPFHAHPGKRARDGERPLPGGSP